MGTEQFASRHTIATHRAGWNGAWRLSVLFMLLLIWRAGIAGQPQDGVFHLTQAQYIISNAKSIPPADAAWQTVQLPHRSSKPTDRDLVSYWYKVAVNLIDLSHPLWLYLPRLPSGGEIYVNGHLMGDIRSADEAVHARWYRPHLFLIPPLLLHEGANTVAVQLAIREPLTSFGEVDIGPEKPLREKYDSLYFWENTMAEISAAICLLAGAVILMFWARRPQEQLYCLFGLCVLLWGCRTLVLRVPIVPIDYLLPWRATYYFATAGFIALITTFMLKFSGADHPRFNKVLYAYWIGGCTIFAIVGMSLRPVMNSYWLPGFLPFTLYSVFQLCRFAFTNRTRASLAMGLAVCLALTLSLHDFVVQEGWFNLKEIYLMHLAIPSFVLVMAGVLSDRLIDSLKAVETVNEQLALQVSAREKDIAASYERVRLLERVNAATEERQRIMQDMHDGVGSHLLTTLVMVERGTASREVTLILLQECLDDMRLAIEALSADDPDLLPVLGNFRFRIESRFKALGLVLKWRNKNMPDHLDLAPHVSLNVLRLLQEALANVLKHAHAAQVLVELQFSARALDISVVDDGVGIGADRGRGGRGLLNMHSRARKIGAHLTIERVQGGTAVRVRIPLGAAGNALTVTPGAIAGSLANPPGVHGRDAVAEYPDHLGREIALQPVDCIEPLTTPQVGPV